MIEPRARGAGELGGFSYSKSLVYKTADSAQKDIIGKCP